MSGKGWRETLQDQQSELQRLEALDADLNLASTDIEKFLKRPKASLQSGSQLPARRKVLAAATDRRKSTGSTLQSQLQSESTYSDAEMEEVNTKLMVDVNLNGGSENDVDNEEEAYLKDTGAAKAPESTIRYQKARIKVLTKQIDDGVILRKQMNEQILELQKQLKAERDENKTLRKRVSTVEIELKRASSIRKAGEPSAASGESIETLQQEVASLKKEVAIAEKVAKQLDVSIS